MERGAEFRIEFHGPQGLCHLRVVKARDLAAAQEQARRSAKGVVKVFKQAQRFRILDANGNTLTEAAIIEQIEM